MPEEKHTPTPFCIRVFDAVRLDLDEENNCLLFGHKSEFYAEFIVQACNSHLKLVDALKAVLAHAEDMTCELMDTDDVTDYPYIVLAKAALAEAEKGT